MYVLCAAIGVPGMGIGGTGMVSMPAPVQNPSSSSYGGVHSVQAISNPSYTGPTVSQGFSPSHSTGMQVGVIYILTR